VINLKGSLKSVEERTKFNNTRLFVLATALFVEQLIYGLLFSEPTTLLRRTYFTTSIVSLVFAILIGLIYLHNRRYDKVVVEGILEQKGYFVVKGVIQYSYLTFLVAAAIFRAVYVSSFNFTIPVIYIAVLYGISFLFYYPPTWTAILYITTSTVFILLSHSRNAEFLYDNFTQDVIVNNALAWFGSILSYQRFGKQVEAIETIEAINKEKDDLIQMRETIIDISDKVAMGNTSDRMYQYILEKCLALVPQAPFGSILMLKENGNLGIKAYIGFNEEEVKDFEISVEESFLYIATEGAMNQTLIINRIREIQLNDKMVGVGEEEFPIKAELASPLILNGKLLGIVCIDSDQEDTFSEKDVFLIDYMTKQVVQVIRRQMLYDEVLHLSKYDSLTSLYNRHTFDRTVGNDLKIAEFHERTVYFAIADLDGLKNTNDVYGHAVGDKMIRNFAMEFRNQLRPLGYCARYGGDEFVFYSSKSTKTKILEQVEQIKINLKNNPIYVDEKEFRVEFSFGMISSDEVGYSEETLYNHADKKMYEEKKERKN
jgi:diguanylate cyclase (GGDEF)-like protein